MDRLFSAFARLLLSALVAAGGLAGEGLAQSQAVSPAAGPSAGSPAAAVAAPDANGALLAKAVGLYYSSARTGLKGFDCSVHPEWRTLFLSATQGAGHGAGQGAAVADDDPRILLLKTANIKLHGRLGGGSSLDWNLPATPEKPLNQDSTELVDQMHQATERTLTGFMQFWSPFVDGSVIPATADGLEITNTEKGHTLHADQGGTSLTEVLDNNLVMQQFNVATGGAKINFSPRYKPTDQGLLVNAFLAHIQAPQSPPEQAEEMHVEIEYQQVGSFPVPARIAMEISGQGKFNFALDGCTVNPQ
jgi:hypothetical protein